MRDRIEPMLKIVCLALAAVVVYQLAGVVIRSHPLSHARIPALPTLSADTNAPAAGKGTNALAAGKGTNVLAATKGTNAAAVGMGTNTAAAMELAKKGTNASPAKPETNSVTVGDSAKPLTNSASITVSMVASNTPGTNAIAMIVIPDKKGTNAALELASVKSGTNATNGTNAASRSAAARKGMGPEVAGMGMDSLPPGMSGMPGAPGRAGRGGPAPELAPPIKARVYRVYDSEILGQIMRPLPMALLGIAGDTAFLRGPNGQTGLAKIGDEVGGLKLLQIGINRVLVEQEGQKKELVIFDGYGSESLLSKEKKESP